jgi:transcriptional regulator with XRE-family HTH domain
MHFAPIFGLKDFMASVTSRKMARGAISWRVQFRIQGQSRQVSFRDKTLAEQFGARIDKVGAEAAIETLKNPRAQNHHGEMNETARGLYAANIKSLRVRAGLTQMGLAGAAGVSRATVISVERGDRIPHREILIKLYQALGIEIEGKVFQTQTQMWLTAMGALIEAVPIARRAPLVDQAMQVLSVGAVPIKPIDVGETIRLLTSLLDQFRGVAAHADFDFNATD